MFPKAVENRFGQIIESTPLQFDTTPSKNFKVEKNIYFRKFFSPNTFFFCLVAFSTNWAVGWFFTPPDGWEFSGGNGDVYGVDFQWCFLFWDSCLFFCFAEGVNILDL